MIRRSFHSRRTDGTPGRFFDGVECRRVHVFGGMEEGRDVEPGSTRDVNLEGGSGRTKGVKCLGLVATLVTVIGEVGLTKRKELRTSTLLYSRTKVPETLVETLVRKVTRDSWMIPDQGPSCPTYS